MPANWLAIILEALLQKLATHSAKLASMISEQTNPIGQSQRQQSLCHAAPDKTNR